MFRKLVANLPFSPALVGQLGFYARRLRREQATRRMGLIFTALALVVQSFAVFQPPESAFAASPSNIIYGGVNSVVEVIKYYDNKDHDFKDLMDYVGIQREELTKMRKEMVCSKDKSIISYGRQHRFSTAEGEFKHIVPSTNKPGAYSTFYSVPLYRFDEVNGHQNCYESFVGSSAKVGWFSIMLKCGNLQIKKNITPSPKGQFIKADCDAIQGYAYDERQADLPVSVVLYIGGPPGKGKKYDPIVANQSTPKAPGVNGNHGFSMKVPEEYRTKQSSTEVWGVLIPLKGWSSATVQLQNTATIPGSCVKPPEKCPIPGKEHLPKDSPDCVEPLAACTALQISTIERTKFRTSATASTSGGAKLKSYTFTVKDKSGKKVYEETYLSDKTSLSSEIFELKTPGDYTASVVVDTSIGTKSDDNCAKPLQVAPENKCPLKPDLPVSHPDCQPCPYDETIWIKDEDCTPKITQSKEAKNITQDGKDASSVVAKPGDRIEYTLYTSNESAAPVTTSVEEELTDILEYAQIIDTGGGELSDVRDNNNPNAPVRKVLTWKNITVQPNQPEARKMVIRINETISAAPQPGGDPGSNNCVISNSYGNTININMDCPIPKGIENTVQELPKTGPGANMAFAGVTATVVTYFYARSRQINKEVKLIRKEFNSGTI